MGQILNVNTYMLTLKSISSSILVILGLRTMCKDDLVNLPVERAKDAVCFLQRCGVSPVS